MTAVADIIWYGERGAVNDMLVRWSNSGWAQAASRFLSAIQWSSGQRHDFRYDSVRALVEIGLAGFGNPDLVLVAKSESNTDVFFVEAKVGSYRDSAIPNSKGMQTPGFSSAINGQLSLKYRFARAAAHGFGKPIVESPGQARAYATTLDDAATPRKLAKPAVLSLLAAHVGEIQLGRCYFVALTGETTGPFPLGPDERPAFLDMNGIVDDEALGRIGWIGFADIAALGQVWSEYEPHKASPDDCDAAAVGVRTESLDAGQAESLRSILSSLGSGARIVSLKGSVDLFVGAERIAKLAAFGPSSSYGNSLLVAVDAPNTGITPELAESLGLVAVMISGRLFYGRWFPDFVLEKRLEAYLRDRVQTRVTA